MSPNKGLPSSPVSISNLIISLLLPLLMALPGQAQDLDVPYVPTPPDVVQKMLEMADVGPGDYVIDLGSGDGRIVIQAAKYGATGLGVDLDPTRVAEARKNALDKGMQDRVLFREQDIFETDISEASVVTLYLLTSVNRELRPRLFDMLRPGTKVVSHRFNMGRWAADKTVKFEGDDKIHTIYYYIMPAQADGIWTWKTGQNVFSLSITQDFQKINALLSANGNPLNVREAVLRGRRISFMADGDSTRYVFSGRIEDGAINGIIQRRGPEVNEILEWKATRK